MGVRNLFDEYLSFVVKNRKLKKDDFKRELFSKFYREFIAQYNRTRETIFQRNNRYLMMLENSLKESGKEIITCEVRTKSRVLCDISSPFFWIPDEIGMAWDPILDTPIIPASEIKGAISAVMEFEGKKELRDILFGGEIICKRKGEAIRIALKSIVDFTDAYPVSSNQDILGLDVMTPHYAKEIEEHKVSPTPVKFLVINPGVTFRFLILIDKIRINERISNREKNICFIEGLRKCGIQSNEANTIIQEIRKQLKIFVKKAFEVWGIGTKTSSGYGIFVCTKFG